MILSWSDKTSFWQLQTIMMQCATNIQGKHDAVEIILFTWSLIKYWQDEQQSWMFDLQIEYQPK